MISGGFSAGNPDPCGAPEGVLGETPADASPGLQQKNISGQKEQLLIQ